jgi:hypothetical protein
MFLWITPSQNMGIEEQADEVQKVKRSENGVISNPFYLTPDESVYASSACSSIPMFLWITPSPPCLAIAIAILDSVTVSIPAEITGM